MKRTVVANLGCEREWAHQTGSPRPPRLPTDIAAQVARMGVTLAVFAEPGDRLWLPADPGTVYTGGVDVVLGALPEGPLLPWGATEATYRDASGSSAPCPIDWLKDLWEIRCAPEVAARVNHRGFADAIARDRGWSLEGSRTVATVDELRAHLEHARLGPEDRWVARAPFSAAGRESIRRRGRQLDDSTATYAARLLRHQGTLTVQPWLAREADLSVCGIVTEETTRVFPPHRAVCDHQGVVRALVVDDADVGLPREHSRPVSSAAEEVAPVLRAAGYRGAFSVDAFVYRDGAALRVHPLSEINARLTFGLAARAAVERSGSTRVALWI